MENTEIQATPRTGSPVSNHSDTDVTKTLLEQLTGELGETAPTQLDTKMVDATISTQSTTEVASILQSPKILVSEDITLSKLDANSTHIDTAPISVHEALDSQMAAAHNSDTPANEMLDDKQIAGSEIAAIYSLEQPAQGIVDLSDSQMMDLSTTNGFEENNINVSENPAAQVIHSADSPGTVDEPAEWEEDSDPISSSDSSDSSDSDSDSDEGDDSFKRLTPAEQARILMADGGSDDEDGPKKGIKEPLQTKNEVTEAILPKPDIIITPDMKIQELGEVMTVVGGTAATVTIRAGASGDIPRLDAGSVLCLEDRSVVAAIADTFGPVAQPFYITRFPNADDVTSLGLTLGTKIFYSEQHAKFVFPSDMRKMKWTDASNIHDEEVNDVEMEFSDDEKEAEYKAKRKANNRDKARGGKMQGDSGERTRGRGRGDRSRGGRGGGRFTQQGHLSSNSSPALNYDEEGDNLYNPLQRPAHFAASSGRSEPPQEQPYGSNKTASVRGSHNRYGGDQQNQHSTNRGSFVPRGMQGNLRGNGAQPQQAGYDSPQPQYQSFPRPPSQSGKSPQNPQWPQFPPQQPNMPYMAPGMPPPFMMPGFPNMPFPPPPMPSGGYINPNFFPNQQTQQFTTQQYPPPQQPQQGQQYQQNAHNQYNQQNQPK